MWVLAGVSVPIIILPKSDQHSQYPVWNHLITMGTAAPTTYTLQILKVVM